MDGCLGHMQYAKMLHTIFGFGPAEKRRQQIAVGVYTMSSLAT